MNLSNYARFSYKDIKYELLSGLFDEFKNNFHTQKILGIEISHKESIAKLYDDFEHAYEKPIEKLMLYTIFIVLDYGYKSQKNEYYYSKFKEIINKNEGISKLLQDIPQDEVSVFKNDLEIIGLL
jgi:hypothetical protein